MSEKSKKFIDIIQWVLIAVLIGFCVYSQWTIKNSGFQEVVVEQDKNGKYTQIYDSQKMEVLKKENKELYDSIKKLKNVESAVVIKYKYKYSTDTVRVTDKQYVAVPVEKNITDTIYRYAEEHHTDSIYHYTENNDTVSYNLDICASQLQWHRLDFQINDRLTLINQNDGNDHNILTVDHGDNMEIEGVTAWHKKKGNSFKDRFFFGPSVNVGYGIFNKKVDVFIGVSVGFDLIK